MYWTDVSENTIKRAKLNGTEVTTIVSDGLMTPGDWSLIEIITMITKEDTKKFYRKILLITLYMELISLMPTYSSPYHWKFRTS